MQQYDQIKLRVEERVLMTDTLAENQKDQNLLPIPILESSSAEPNMHLWLTEAKKDSLAPFVGMYLTHNGVVRATPKRVVRPESSTNNASKVEEESRKVVAVGFTYDKQKLAQALQEACTWEGVYYVRAWLNKGTVPVGDSLMYILIGADIRPHAVDALTKLVETIKTKIVTETELYHL